MTDYQIKWTETAIQSLDKIERDLERRILKRVNGLNVNPFRYVKRLKAVPLFSLRVGIYRVYEHRTKQSCNCCLRCGKTGERL